MQTLGSRALSCESLSKGAEILRATTMTLENDPEYAELLKERDRLLATCQLL